MIATLKECDSSACSWGARVSSSSALSKLAMDSLRVEVVYAARLATSCNNPVN